MSPLTYFEGILTSFAYFFHLPTAMSLACFQYCIFALLLEKGVGLSPAEGTFLAS